jgi:AcrR family transcriptional regulator
MSYKTYSPHLSTARDQRAIRTREALRRSLLNLLKNKPLDQITIRDITTKANVGYASFFRHYPTKEALLIGIVTEQFANVINSSLPIIEAGGEARAAAIALFTYVGQYRALWSTLLTGGAAGAVREQFVRFVSKLAAVRSHPGQRFPTDISVIFASTGTIELLAWWLRQKAPLPIEEVADIFDHFVIAPTLSNDATDAWRVARSKKMKRK